MKYNFIKIISAMAFLLSLFVVVNGQQSGWRGPGKSGIYNEKGLMKTWPASGPELLWEVTGLGAGFSSATVTDDAICK